MSYTECIVERKREIPGLKDMIEDYLVSTLTLDGAVIQVYEDAVEIETPVFKFTFTFEGDDDVDEFLNSLLETGKHKQSTYRIVSMG